MNNAQVLVTARSKALVYARLSSGIRVPPGEWMSWCCFFCLGSEFCDWSILCPGECYRVNVSMIIIRSNKNLVHRQWGGTSVGPFWRWRERNIERNTAFDIDFCTSWDRGSGSPVGIATGLRAGRSGIETGWDEIFRPSRTALGPI
jgi:hypothetical protein